MDPELDISRILLDLFLMYALATLGSEVFQRLKQPAVVGELLAGILIAGLALTIRSPVYDVVAEIGLIVLLFTVGLETRFSSILQVGRTATLVAVIGVIVPFLLGYGVMAAAGQSSLQAFLLGSALTATSVGITARVLSDLGVARAPETCVILGAAVIDDIIALILLSVVSGAGRGSLYVTDVAILAAAAIAFTVFVALVGTRATRRYGSLLEKLHLHDAPFVTALLICLGLSAAASLLHLSALIGAFLAGMAFAETQDRYALEERIQPIYAFLVPFFFVVMGTKVDLGTLLKPDILSLALVITLLAMVGKVVGCGLAAMRMGRFRASIVGVGMMPRGEMGIVVALVGLRLGLIGDDIYGTIIFMALVTTLVTPPLLKLLYHRAKPTPSAPTPALEGQPACER
ncbi:MAG: cation:proton antiporter [Chloroflexi bacterium]|nr:cation:proton antiporter [Chloroflexota bacterium]